MKSFPVNLHCKFQNNIMLFLLNLRMKRNFLNQMNENLLENLQLNLFKVLIKMNLKLSIFIMMMMDNQFQYQKLIKVNLYKKKI